MKKFSTIIMAIALVLGLAQCKKQEIPATPDDDGKWVHITLNMGDSGKHIVYPNTGAVVYTENDTIYVGNDGKFIGKLVYHSGAFSGDIYDPQTTDYLHFYFLGGLNPGKLTPGSTENFTVDISDQSSNLPVLSYGHSSQKYTTSSATYACTLGNQCALVEFDLGEVDIDAPIALTGMKNEATINFADNTVTSGATPGNIVTYGTGTTRYAIVLSDQPAVNNGNISAEGYEGTFSIPTAAYTNAFLKDATMTLTAAPIPIDPLFPPLTLEALTDGSIRVKTSSVAMKYSKNGGPKTPMNLNDNTFIDVFEGDKVAFYCNGTNTASYKGTRFYGGTANVKAYGNIMSLFDEDNYSTANELPVEEALYALFGGNEKLIDASGLLLPATTLTFRCYCSMFYECTNLTAAPALPATTLAERCYESMFASCPSLTTAPVLPAPTLVTYCYYMMFFRCTSLNFVTCLATNLGPNYSTYSWLEDVASTGTFFTPNTTNWTMNDPSGIPSGWTRANGEGYPLTPFTLEALTNGEIDVINNSGIAMKYSKNGGPKITVDPNDIAIINVSEGDKVAFYCNGTNTASYNGIRFNGTAYVKAYGNIMSLFDEDNYSTANTLPEQALRGLFTSCHNLRDASGLLLPATTLTSYCYYGMFEKCAYLTAAPTLFATTLAESCYESMFEGCTFLNSVTCLATDISASNCLNDWLKDAGQYNAQPKLYVDPSMTGANWNNGIFTVTPIP